MCILFFFLSFFQCKSQLINEISPYPLSGVPEWIELYNNDTIDLTLKGVYISDNTTRQYVGDIHLKSKEYAILSKDTALLKKALLSPISVYFIQTTLPVLNNTKDRIILSAMDGTILDSLSYSFMKIYRGYSLERSQTIHDSLSLCTDPHQHTCGFVNSRTPVNNDILIDDVTVQMDSMLISISNLGYIQVDSIDLLIKSSTKNQIVHINSIQSLQRSSLVVSLKELCSHYGYNTINVSIQNNHKDPRRHNDSINTIIYRSFPYQSIRINEINVKPGVYPEYIELYIVDSTYQNISITLEVNNNRILIDDSSNKKYILISTESISIDNQQSSNRISKSLSINDKEGTIKIIDKNNQILDSMNYSKIIEDYESYTGKYSFEYIDSLNNWQLSTNEHGGTPGTRNSSIHKPINDLLSVDRIPRSNSLYQWNRFNINQPFILGVYSCDAFSQSGIFIKNLIRDKIIASECIIDIQNEPILQNQVVMLLHTVKDFKGNRVCYKITPIVMRN